MVLSIVILFIFLFFISARDSFMASVLKCTLCKGLLFRNCTRALTFENFLFQALSRGDPGGSGEARSSVSRSVSRNPIVRKCDER